MIRKIGVIFQDRNSFGFLRGLRDRLKCEAELIAPPTAIGKQKRLTRADAIKAWRFFQIKGVDLVVRFTDADGDRWQDIARGERGAFPDDAGSMLICAVAVNNPEEWLSLDANHLSQALGIPAGDLGDRGQRTGRIKRAITRLARGGDDKSEVVAALVRNTPHEVFHRWLQADGALRKFYSECRGAAAADNCETPNELDASE